MKPRMKRRRGFTLVELLVVITIIATLAGIATPMLLKRINDGNKLVAIQNLKSVGSALITFDTEYGNFPDQASATEVTQRTGSTIGPLTGSTSNDYLRQLVASGILDDERVFYCKSEFTKKPDNDITGNKALANGEVGFGYILNSATEGQSTSGNGRRPVLVAGITLAGGNTAPSAPASGLQTGNLGSGGAAGGVRDVLGDVNVFNGKAPVLLLDGSVTEAQVRPSDKKIILVDGGNRSLLQTGEDTAWGTERNPVLVKPKAKGGN